jgi:hypothetical protein
MNNKPSNVPGVEGREKYTTVVTERKSTCSRNLATLSTESPN